MKDVYAVGWGLWTPGFESTSAWLSGRRNPDVAKPRPKMLSSRIGRYTSEHTRLALQVLEQAAEHAELDLGRIATVYGSAYGEICIAFEQMVMIREEGVCSPARFKNSVHNAAGGHGAIASGNHRFSTAIAAGSSTFAMGLLEAMAWLSDHGGDLILVVADEHPPDFVTQISEIRPLGVAIALSASPRDRAPSVRVSGIARGTNGGRTAPQEHWINNPCAPALHLLHALATGHAGTVSIAGDNDGWSIEVG